MQLQLVLVELVVLLIIEDHQEQIQKLDIYFQMVVEGVVLLLEESKMDLMEDLAEVLPMMEILILHHQVM